MSCELSSEDLIPMNQLLVSLSDISSIFRCVCVCVNLPDQIPVLILYTKLSVKSDSPERACVPSAQSGKHPSSAVVALRAKITTAFIGMLLP